MSDETSEISRRKFKFGLLKTRNPRVARGACGHARIVGAYRLRCRTVSGVNILSGTGTRS